MKVSLFVHELSGNAIVRAYPIAKAIQYLGHEVEVLGLTYNTDKIYEPYKDAFEYKTVRSYLDIRWVIINGRKLSKMATGDMAYAFKPIWDSLFPALLYSRMGIRRRLILDAEDNELYDAFIGNGWKALRKSRYYPINPVYNKLLHPFTWLVKRKTVANSSLQKRYGGIIVLHGPNAKKFDPEKFANKDDLRKKYGIPQDVPTVVFAGKPVFYNGLDAVTDALMHSEADDWHLVLAGNPENEAFKKAKNVLGERCHLTGFVPIDSMPEVIKMCDVAPIIQTPCPSTQYQTPAKMLEAMAMAKGIIATDVCDLKTTIGKERGWMTEYGDTAALAGLLKYIRNHPEELKDKGVAARKYFVDNASVETIAERIKPYFEQ